jgi:hypothetical protein
MGRIQTRNKWAYMIDFFKHLIPLKTVYFGDIKVQHYILELPFWLGPKRVLSNLSHNHEALLNC